MLPLQLRWLPLPWLTRRRAFDLRYSLGRYRHITICIKRQELVCPGRNDRQFHVDRRRVSHRCLNGAINPLIDLLDKYDLGIKLLIKSRRREVATDREICGALNISAPRQW
jgi:hypothetical protein